MPFLSYAQNNEDVLLWRAFRDVPAGFYVDVGAADPDRDSVTRAFYDRGWHGINIEPVPGMAARIAAARPRDMTLAIAAGDTDGTIALQCLHGTGLSTTHPATADAMAGHGYLPEPFDVPVRRLASVLDEHAPDEIHFLKIDVEGSERAVLEGCDFRRHRPRVVLVEAIRPHTTEPSHADWEDLLDTAGYRFLFFDGLNRFYAADEWWAALAPAFATPVNVFDDVVRVTEMRQAAAVEADLRLTLDRAVTADATVRESYARAFEQARNLGIVQQLLHDAEGVRAALELTLSEKLAAAEQRIVAEVERTAVIEERLREAERLLGETLHSTSWRVTGPLRSAAALARGRRPVAPGTAAPLPDPIDPWPRRPEAVVEPSPDPMPARRPSGPLRTVHQFHPGSALGDAVTASMLVIRTRLRSLGYRSEIFVVNRDEALADELRRAEHLPEDDGYVLIVHHSMGHPALDRILSLPAPKVLYYHNVTPAEWLAAGPLGAFAELGRRQLTALRGSVEAAIAASEYNALELRRLGFDPVSASALLFDLDALRARAAEPCWRDPDGPFTVLFVGRVIASKAQADLVDAFAAFRSRLGRPARLVLAGRTDTPGDYLATIDTRMRAHGLEAELVVTGGISDAELHLQYSAADLYVSLSHHEGFGVPLVEAIAYGIPVLAWGSGAVPYTLSSGLLDSREADRVADAMLSVATDPARRAALLADQAASLDRFALDRQWPPLQQALSLAGAAPPADKASRAALAPRLHYAVEGHAAGTYSLAAINRGLAASIDAERPGRARLVPVEGVRSTDVSHLPHSAQALALRPPPPTAPEVVISQHYPIHEPGQRGDLTLALVFWEESLLPPEMVATLDRGFDAVLAPSAFVAKALTDSGVRKPVRVIGAAPDLTAFDELARHRCRTPADGVFTFLHVSSCFPRKGVDVLLAAYAKAFRRGDPVRLVIKGFPNPHNTVPADVAALSAADPSLPAIEVIDEDLDQPAMLALYAAADAMVLPTRGEGLNLPAAEAMAAGLPLVVTGFGGHMEFCGPSDGCDVARLLAYRLQPSGSHLASGHSLWAEPDLDDLVAALRELERTRREPVDAARLAARTGRARGHVAARLGRRAMVRRIETASIDLLLAPPPRPLRIGWVTSWAVRCGVAEYTRYLIAALPPDPAVAGHVILSDDRHPTYPAARPPSRVSWRLGEPDTLDMFEHAVTAEDLDVVVIQHQPGLMPWAGLAAWLTAPVLARRVVAVTLHNTRHLTETAPDVQAAVLGALAGAARVMVHARADVARLQDMGLTENVTLLPHGVVAPRPPSPPRDVGDAPLIGCYGFFLPDKGIGELIEALALLRRTRPGARLRLVNADYGAPISAQEIAKARATADASGVADAIEWHTGFLEDDASLALLSGCDVVALPTQTSKEGSSAAVRQALAAGVPVLVTPLPLYDDTGDAVIRAQGVEPAQLAAALDTLLADPGTRSRVQNAAAAWLQAHSWSGVATRFQGMLIGLEARTRGTVI